MTKETTQKKEYTIDAAGKSVGRVATEAAEVLRGKNTPEFVRNSIPNVQVQIVNAAQVRIPAGKREQKIYQTYSGHPGGRKETTMEEIITDKGYVPVFEHAVYGMLPANRLRKQMMKNLIVTE